MDFKYIRNRIREYSLETLIEGAIFWLNKNVPDFWSILTFIEWSYIHADEPYLAKTKKADNETVERICRFIFSLMSEHHLSNFKTVKHRKFFSAIAHQQFSENVTIATFSRQVFIFDIEENNSKIKQEFQMEKDISMKDFLEASYLLYMFSLKHSLQYSLNIIESLKNVECQNKINKYVDILTLYHEKGKEICKKFSNAIKQSELQIFNHDFFIYYPFMKYNGVYKIIHKRCFQTTIHKYLFNYLKNNSASKNMEKKFEQWVNFGIEEAGISYLTEDKLKDKFPQTKVCDFVLEDSVLVECKAIDIKPIAKVNQTDEIMENNLDAIIKAYAEQFPSTARNLSTQNHSTEKEYFALIITYLETYLGDGIDIYEECLEKYISKRGLSINPILPENVFILSINDWDMLVQILKYQQLGIVELITEIKNMRQKERMMSFSQYIEKFKIEKIDLGYVDKYCKPLEEYFKNIITA